MNVRHVIVPINRLGIKFEQTKYFFIDLCSFQPQPLSIRIVKSGKKKKKTNSIKIILRIKIIIDTKIHLWLY